MMALCLSHLTLSIGTALLTLPLAQAQEAAFEIIEVHGAHQGSYTSVTPEAQAPVSDISGLLTQLPGTAVNGNGPLTGIAQYRGLFGDRVNTQVNGVSLAGAGPNAMDTPLSYASLINSERIEMHRGIAPVSAGTDTLGGSIKVIESQASFNDTQGRVAAQYQGNGAQSHLGAKVNVGGKEHALLVYGDLMHGDEDMKSGNDLRISPSGYDKQIIGGQYRFNLSDKGLEDESIAIGYQHLETTEAGTPALPMDIDFIRTDRVKLEGQHRLNTWELDWHLAYSDARHGMDNFSERQKPESANARYNNAESKSYDMALTLGRDAWLFGLDSQLSEHNSVITDPTKPMFRVDNFNQVQNDTYSAFAQWLQEFDLWHWQLGARVKHYRSEADEVSHSMAGAMPAIKALMDRYNQADRAQAQTGVDLVINGRYHVNGELTWILGLARKQDSASYQQRYLWIPMESTGGLADGRTYVGKVDLDLETAYQLELGADFNRQGLNISPRIFLHRIDDYIQGVKSNDPAVIMAANMMGNQDPMEFANVDAQLLGMDINASYELTDQWQLDLMASYVSGERRDIDDNLYRIAPPRVNLGLNFTEGNWSARIEGVMVAAQDKVSQSQAEQTSAGYGLVNLMLAYDGQNWLIKAGINNLFDIDYEDHLGGYNRVFNADLTPGQRMPGTGLNAWLTGEYRF
ncbi:TonB-dependent receptor [Shewanella sp. Isolate7]|uniref:TonB-dependent receptor n=1 Tax=Shewanella sp. Isolate7 TaxID=2908528 RepID=UPI001EFE12C5|nr:TonB-dependent receptor [Shewanella sp. Isolate7]MCG9719979.1 TonB-dependent receptor [Shewanella sp. Isolate7]